MSMPITTVTGADFALATLPGLKHVSKRPLASGVRTNTKRAGQQLADVGPHFSSSYSASSVSSPTPDDSRKNVGVRACVKSWSVEVCIGGPRRAGGCTRGDNCPVFQPNQHEVRRFFCGAWRKQRLTEPLTPIETLASLWIE